MQDCGQSDIIQDSVKTDCCRPNPSKGPNMFVSLFNMLKKGKGDQSIDPAKLDRHDSVKEVCESGRVQQLKQAYECKSGESTSEETFISVSGVDSRITVYPSDIDDEVTPPTGRIPALTAVFYSADEELPPLSDISFSSDSSVFLGDDVPPMENGDENGLVRPKTRRGEAGADKENTEYAHEVDQELHVLDEYLEDEVSCLEKTTYTDDEELEMTDIFDEEPSFIRHRSRSSASIDNSYQDEFSKDNFGYEFASMNRAAGACPRRRHRLLAEEEAVHCKRRSAAPPAAARAALRSARRLLKRFTEHHLCEGRYLARKPVLSSSCASASVSASVPQASENSANKNVDGAIASSMTSSSMKESDSPSMEKLKQALASSQFSSDLKPLKLVHPHSRSASTLTPYDNGDDGSRQTMMRSSSGFSSMCQTPPPCPSSKIRRSFRVEVSSPMSRSLHLPSSESTMSMNGYQHRHEPPLYADVFASKHAFYRGSSLDEEDETGDGENMAALLRDFDYDDTKSCISSASTSRLGLNGGRGGRGHHRVRTANDMRNFLRSPVRLRRRDKHNDENAAAIEAGFEPSTNVARCHSVHSLAYSRSQFTPSVDLNESLRSVGINYTPSGPPQQQPPPPPPPHRPVPIDGVIGGGGRRIHVRDSASASPHSFNNRRSLQQLNSSGAVYANLGGSFQEFSPTGGGGGERKPPLPTSYRGPSGDVASPSVIMRHGGRDAAPILTSTPQSSRRHEQHHQHAHNGHHHLQHQQLSNGYHAAASPQMNTRFSVAAPMYYEDTVVQQRHIVQVQPSSHRSSIKNRTNSSGGLAVTTASGTVGGRGMVTSVSHHDGYPNAAYMEECSVDDHASSSAGSSFERDRIRYLEDRLKTVEQYLTNNGTPNLARSARHHARLPGSTDALLAEKDEEIAKLQRRLEQQQVHYEEEIRTIRSNTDSVSGEQYAFKQKLERMQRELEEYKERASRVSDSTAAAAQDLIDQKESDLASVRAELSALRKEKDMIEKRQEQIAFLQMQNETLNAKLDDSEAKVKGLEENLVTLRLEQSMYQQSCSSGSTPLADDETRSLADARTPHAREGIHEGSASVGGGGQLAKVRQYQKAHSSLGASGIAITPSSSSPSPLSGGTPKSNGLVKSLSNYHLDDKKRLEEFPPQISVLLRKTQKLSFDSRSLAHCLRECATKMMKGEAPETSMMVGRVDISDSSDCEVVTTDCTKMGVNEAEKMLKQQDVALEKLHKNLTDMNNMLNAVYYRRFEAEVQDNDESCRVM